MAYFGKVRNGRIILDPGARLAEGERVRVESINGTNGPLGAPDRTDGLSSQAVHGDGAAEDIFAEMAPYTVRQDDADDSRDAIYRRMVGE